MTYDLYGSALGGHVPGYLRREFDTFVQTGEVRLPAEPSYLSYSEGVEARLQWLIWELWHCSDILPTACCGRLGLGLGATYAEAARFVGQREEARQL
ncbi:MAG: hypothetical protein QOG21_1758 [Actinomycetota bacterium]|nr:hypothetical protein [Actinomycetota bacterium]